ncbi:MAG TPA: hypothetical protein PLE30_10655 [Candidatus Kapabacteria bacterium]|nr:hypothetical protein [Candidatus Kapabacteria bacterium]
MKFVIVLMIIFFTFFVKSFSFDYFNHYAFQNIELSSLQAYSLEIQKDSLDVDSLFINYKVRSDDTISLVKIYDIKYLNNTVNHDDIRSIVSTLFNKIISDNPLNLPYPNINYPVDRYWMIYYPSKMTMNLINSNLYQLQPCSLNYCLKIFALKLDECNILKVVPLDNITHYIESDNLLNNCNSTCQ